MRAVRGCEVTGTFVSSDGRIHLPRERVQRPGQGLGSLLTIKGILPNDHAFHTFPLANSMLSVWGSERNGFQKNPNNSETHAKKDAPRHLRRTALGGGVRDRESLKWGIRVGTRCPSEDTRVPHGGKITDGTATIRNVPTHSSAGERR